MHGVWCERASLLATYLPGRIEEREEQRDEGLVLHVEVHQEARQGPVGCPTPTRIQQWLASQAASQAPAIPGLGPHLWRLGALCAWRGSGSAAR